MKNKIEINCHSSIKINSNLIIYIDPFKINNKCSDADIIFITHDHYDHYDIESINNIRKNDTIIVIPSSMKNKVLNDFIGSNIFEVIPNKEYELKGIRFNTVPSYNVNKKFHLKEYNWVGYLIDINGELIYIAGDTDETLENRNIKCDVALVPIGGTYTMNYMEAANLINYMKPKVVIPTHYGEIVGTIEDGIKFKELIIDKIDCILLIK